MQVTEYNGVYKNGNSYVVVTPTLARPSVGKYCVTFDNLEAAIKQREEWSKLLCQDRTPVANTKSYDVDWSFIESSFTHLKGVSSIDKSLLKDIKRQLFGFVTMGRNFRFCLQFPTCAKTFVLKTEEDVPFVKDVLLKAQYSTTKAKRIAQDKLDLKSCEEFKKDHDYMLFTGRHYIVRKPARLPSNIKVETYKFAAYEEAKALRDSIKQYYCAPRSIGNRAPYLKENFTKGTTTKSLDLNLVAKLKAISNTTPQETTVFAEDVYILNEVSHTYIHLGPCSKLDILARIVELKTSDVVVMLKNTNGDYKVLNVLV